MKRFIIPLAAAAAAMLVSCNKDITPDNPTNDEPRYELALSFPDVEMATKVALSSADNAVSNIQVMVFKADGSLENSVNLNSTSGSINVTAGEKTVYAVANVPTSKHSFLNAASASAITSVATALSDNTIGGAFVMIGNNTVTVSGASSCSISLYRIAAKIEMGNISVAMSDAFAGQSLKVDRIYVQNAVVNSTFAKSKTLATSDFVNQLKFTSNSYDSYLTTPYTSVTLSDVTSASTALASKYYVYPNQTTTDARTTPTFTIRKTRLVIQATLNGKTTFYPVTLGPIESNKYYKVTGLTVTGPGVDNPEDDPTKAGLTVSVTVVDWAQGQEINVTI